MGDPQQPLSLVGQFDAPGPRNPLIPIASDARLGKPPCGECHLQPGETCDICGAERARRITDMRRHSLRARKLMRYDPGSKMLRVGRVVWQRGEVGDGQGYSTKLTLGLRPALFSWRRESRGWKLIVLGVRVHLDRSYGGIHV